MSTGNLEPSSLHSDPERRTIINVYIGLGIALVMGFVPLTSAALASIFFLIGVLIWAYIVRSKSEPQGLADNHMTYIIGTIWIGGLVSCLTLILGAGFMFLTIDNAPMMPCIEHLRNTLMDMSNLADTAGVEDRIWKSLEGCKAEYWQVNMISILASVFIAIVPVIVYFGVRYFRGFSRAIKGYRLAKPDGWL